MHPLRWPGGGRIRRLQPVQPRAPAQPESTQYHATVFVLVVATLVLTAAVLILRG